MVDNNDMADGVEEEESKKGFVTDLPLRYYNEIGKMHLLKGKDTTGTKQIITWEMVKVCRAERCDAYGLCEYGDSGFRRCRIEMSYLRTVSLVLYRSFASVLDEPTMMRVGLHLMPLYQNLCRFLIVEIGAEALIPTAKGGVIVNPVYKEIREHIKLIELTWRSLGLNDYFVETSPGDELGTYRAKGSEILAATKAIGVDLGARPTRKQKVVRRKVVDG